MTPAHGAPLRRALVALLCVLGAACTMESKLAVSPSSPPGSASASPGTTQTSSPADQGSNADPGPLCKRPKASPGPTPSPTTLPSSIQAVADQVEAFRSLRFEDPVNPEPVTHDRLVELLNQSVDRSFPRPKEAQRGRAWATMGAIPATTDLGQAYRDFSGTQVIGFYDTITHRLVFVGTSNPSPLSRTILAHELTHALDDQAFGLERLDQLENECRDERLQAFLGLAEGDATSIQLRYMSRLTSAEQLDLSRELAGFDPIPPTVPPFLRSILQFPYTSGRTFVDALVARGGEAAVDAAFRRPPVSTEQILHPTRYPGDSPQNIEVSDIREKLGGPWQSIDVMDVGEEWLLALLEQRLPQSDSTTAAAGWDGGQYRAWSRDDQTVVLLQTVWDRDADAAEFATAMRRFVGSDGFGSVHRRGSRVDVLFGSDAGALRDLERAVG